MGWLKGFFKEKHSKEEDTWAFRYDERDGSKYSVRVDTKYVKAQYRHTYSIQIKNGDDTSPELPMKEFLDKIYDFEDKLIEFTTNIAKGEIVYLGCTNFGKLAALFCASNHDIEWLDFISEYFGYTVAGDAYRNDNMLLYNAILYPKNKRKKKK